jgi:prepilin-type processing-associated H-X9-DG protein
MKIDPKFHSNHKAFTLVELVLVLFVIFIVMFLVILPLASNKKHRTPYSTIACVNQLKMIGLSFRIFATDNEDRFPMEVPEEEGGSMEYKDNPLAAYRHFQVMSNELSVPKVLVCRADKRVEATNFNTSMEPDPTKGPAVGPQVGNSTISYFVGVDASEKYPEMMLTGDRNLMVDGKDLSQGKSLMLTLTPEGARFNNPLTSNIQYSPSIHKDRGNVALADGSVQQWTSAALISHLLRSNRVEGEPMDRLAIPGLAGQ